MKLGMGSIVLRREGKNIGPLMVVVVLVRRGASSCEAMSRSSDMVRDIDNRNETFKLVVRIVDLWYVQMHDKARHLEMI